MRRHGEYIQKLGERFLELAAEHTADEQLREKVVPELRRLAREAEQK